MNNKNLTYKNILCMHFTEPSSTIFIQSNATATIFSAHFCVAGSYIFEGGVYLFGKLADIHDDWIRYIRACCDDC